MADDISIHSAVAGNNFSDRVFEIETTFNGNILNFTNKIFEIEEQYQSVLFDFKNYTSRIEFPSHTPINISSANETPRTYLMRAKKVSDSSYVYWRTSAIDYYAVESGFQFNLLSELCVVAYD
jgi:hypothetical protein